MNAHLKNESRPQSARTALAERLLTAQFGPLGFDSYEVLLDSLERAEGLAAMLAETFGESARPSATFDVSPKAALGTAEALTRNIREALAILEDCHARGVFRDERRVEGADHGK